MCEGVPNKTRTVSPNCPARASELNECLQSEAPESGVSAYSIVEADGSTALASSFLSKAGLLLHAGMLFSRDIPVTPASLPLPLVLKLLSLPATGPLHPPFPTHGPFAHL